MTHNKNALLATTALVWWATATCAIAQPATAVPLSSLLAAPLSLIGGKITIAPSALTALAGAPGAAGAPGVSITGAAVNGSGHLVVSLSSGATMDAGALPAGATGTAGSAGSTGAPGVAGAPGAPGVSITAAAVSGSNHLMLTTSAGSTLDAGVLPPGPAGTPGANTLATTSSPGAVEIDVPGAPAASTNTVNALAVSVGKVANCPIVYVPRSQQGAPGCPYGPGYPSQAFPADPTAKPMGWPVSDVGNLSNLMYYGFGSANGPTRTNNPLSVIANRAQLDANFEHNQSAGGANDNIDGQVKDTNPSFAGVFRSYPHGDPNDTTVVTPAGLELRARCIGGTPAGTSCAGAGNIVAGIVRSEYQVPEDLVVAEMCGLRPAYEWAWPTNWFYDNGYPPPQPTDFAFYGTSGYPTHTNNPNEIDWWDGFVPGGADGQSPAHWLTANLPGPVRYPANKQIVFVAASGGFTPSTFDGANYLSTAFDMSSEEICTQVEKIAPKWADAARTIGSVTQHGHVVFSLARKDYTGTWHSYEYEDSQFDADGTPELDGGNNPTGRSFMPQSWMVALQIAPTWTPIGNSQMTPDAMTDTKFVIKSMGLWARKPGTVHVAPALANGITPVGQQSVFPAPSLPIDFTQGAIPTNVLFSRASSVKFAAPNGAISQIGLGVAPMDSRGVLIEPASTAIGGGVTAKLDATVSASAGPVGPDGVTPSTALIEAATNYYHVIGSVNPPPFVSGSDYSFQLAVRRTAGSAVRNLQFNDNSEDVQVFVDVGACSVTNQSTNASTAFAAVLINGWCHVTGSFTAGPNVQQVWNASFFPGDASSNNDYNGDAVSGFDIADWQIEQAPYPTSIIAGGGSRPAAQVSFTVPSGKTALTATFSDGSTEAIGGLTPGAVYTTPVAGLNKPILATIQ